MRDPQTIRDEKRRLEEQARRDAELRRLKNYRPFNVQAGSENAFGVALVAPVDPSQRRSDLRSRRPRQPRAA